MKFILKTRYFVDIYIALYIMSYLSLTWHVEIQVQFIRIKQNLPIAKLKE